MPSLNLAITRLNIGADNNFLIWVVRSPEPNDADPRPCVWPQYLTQICQEWRQMFAGPNELDLPPGSTDATLNQLPMDLVSLPSGQAAYSIRLMQYLGISLWRWVFEGEIGSSLVHSRGIAQGEKTPLRLRLEIRDPRLIGLPWEIMQKEPGQPTISLSQQHILFSRTSSKVERLPPLQLDPGLNILLVLGHDDNLQLEEEAAILKETLANDPALGNNTHPYVPCMVKTLMQPTPGQLIQELESGAYNVLFYAGHGKRGPDGGFLLLGPGMTLNGIELAQVLNRTRVKLAVFNACWGAQPAADANGHAIPSSSLAEVLISHGVPAVLGMRDQIANIESHTFIKAFAQALRKRLPIDEAVADARKQLLAVYRFNNSAWTLPVLYLHPDFDGELISKSGEGITEYPPTIFPTTNTDTSEKWTPNAFLRCLSPGGKTWEIGPGVNRIGRIENTNHISSQEAWVSQQHAQIFCRYVLTEASPIRTYFLQDMSRFGSWISGPNGWQQIFHEEVPLKSGTQLKFGSFRGEIWEFTIEEP